MTESGNTEWYVSTIVSTFKNCPYYLNSYVELDEHEIRVKSITTGRAGLEVLRNYAKKIVFFDSSALSRVNPANKNRRKTMKKTYLYMLAVIIITLTGCDLQFTSSQEELETKSETITGTLDEKGYTEVELPKIQFKNLKVECEVIDPLDNTRWEGAECKVEGKSGRTIVTIELNEIFANLRYRITYTYSE